MTESSEIDQHPADLVPEPKETKGHKFLIKYRGKNYGNTGYKGGEPDFNSLEEAQTRAKQLDAKDATATHYVQEQDENHNIVNEF